MPSNEELHALPGNSQEDLDSIFGTIEDMNKEEEAGKDAKEEEIVEEESAEEVVEEKEEESADEADDKKKDESEEGEQDESEEADEEGEGTEEEESSAEDTVSREEYNRVLQQLNEMSKGVTGFKKDEESKEEEEKEVSVDHKIVEFIKDDEAYEDTFKDRGKFNAFINDVVKTAINVAVTEALKRTPEVVVKQTDSRIEIKRKLDSFFSDNQDFEPIREYVMKVGASVESKHPEWAGNLDKIFEETEKEVRARLNLKKVAQKSVEGKRVADTKNRLRGTQKGKGGSGPKLTALEKEVAETFGYKH